MVNGEYESNNGTCGSRSSQLTIQYSLFSSGAASGPSAKAIATEGPTNDPKWGETLVIGAAIVEKVENGSNEPINQRRIKCLTIKTNPKRTQNEPSKSFKCDMPL